jgi:thioredoxin
MTHEVTMENFEATVESHEMVILDFWADWCQPCKILAPVFEELSKHHPDIHFGKVNTERAQDLAQAFQVKSIPTLMAFKKGELVFEQAGLLTPPQLEKLVEGLRTLEPEPMAMEQEPQ